MGTRLISHCRHHILPLLVLLLLVGMAATYAAIKNHPHALLIERIAPVRPVERNFPRDPTAENVQQATIATRHILTYTTSADIGEINEFYTQALLRQNWRCAPLGRYHADVDCLWLGRDDGLSWDLHLTRHLTMIPGGSRVEINWGRVPNYHRLPLFPGGHITETARIGCVDAIPDLVDPTEFCGPYTHIYDTPAALTQVQAFYADIFAVSGSWSPKDIQWQQRIQLQAQPDGGTQVTIR